MKKITSAFALLCFASLAFPQIQLTERIATWRTVLPGKMVTKPETTPYGIICSSDDKKITSFSNSGVVLWEKRVPGSASPFITTISDDFTVAVTESNKKITLINPSGVELWSRTSPWEITAKPYEGRDGRFFLRGKRNVCCYGMNGICKWDVRTDEQSNLPLQELPDGTLVIFLKPSGDNGKSRALRITPFGETIEEIIFAGEIVSTASTSEGVLLTFANGIAGFFSVENNLAENKWVFQADSSLAKSDRSNFFAASKDCSDCYFVTRANGGAKVFRIDSKSGKTKSEFTVPDLNIEKVVDSHVESDGFFVLDEKNVFYFDENDNLTWSAKMPDMKKKKWHHAVFTTDGSLVLTYENWTIASYRISQVVPKTAETEEEKPSYNSYFNVSPAIYNTIYKYQFKQDAIIGARLSSLKNGFYGKNEPLFVSEAVGTVSAYIQHLKSNSTGTKTARSVFETNSTAIQNIYSQIQCFGTNEFAHHTARLIAMEKDSFLLGVLLGEIKNNGYDPDGEILDALQNLADFTPNPSPMIVENACDAVYSICRFMGRAAFIKSGKKILTSFLSSSSREKVRETLKTLGELGF